LTRWPRATAPPNLRWEKLARAHAIFLMTARHKKKTKSHPAVPSAVSQESVEAKRHERWREIWISFWMSIAITFVLLGVKKLVEKTDFGARVQALSYDLLQLHLTAAENLPVIVLDISGIPMTPGLGAHPEAVTDREPLRKIVESLTGKVGGNAPKAIGLDVDFSPDSHGYAHPDDPALFDRFLILEKSKNIPIRVGVNSSLALGPQMWLRDPKYNDLASCVVVPNPEKGRSAWYMPQSLVVSYQAASFGGIEEHCTSMGVALANAVVNPVPSWMGWFAETFRQIDNDDRVTKSEFLVDYSPLERLRSSSKEIYDSSADVPINVDVGGKLVLLGRTKNTMDMFTVPGRPEQPYPGVFLHACAAYSLLERPLLRLREPSLVTLDILFSLAIFGPLLWRRLSLHKQGKEVVLGHRIPGLLSLLVAIALVVVAISIVRSTHLMWDDFLLVAIVLVVHTPIEESTVEFGKWLTETLRSWRHASTPASRSHSEGE
jgi:CHASE2 domain-containing sensor protein